VSKCSPFNAETVARGGGCNGTEEAIDMVQSENDVATTQLPPEGTYDLDLAHTQLEFVARHLLSKVRGRFTDFSGTFVIGETPDASSAEVEIRADSLTTHTEQRDQHLKSPDFLSVEEYPTLTFRSTAARVSGRDRFELDGDLTIRDQTRPITLVGEYLGTGTDPYGKTIISATAKATLEREDWNVSWNMLLETGGFLVSKTVDLELEVEGTKTG
jgi:polyisoprenoid-binding protein YceI